MSACLRHHRRISVVTWALHTMVSQYAADQLELCMVIELKDVCRGEETSASGTWHRGLFRVVAWASTLRAHLPGWRHTFVSLGNKAACSTRRYPLSSGASVRWSSAGGRDTGGENRNAYDPSGRKPVSNNRCRVPGAGRGKDQWKCLLSLSSSTPVRQCSC